VKDILNNLNEELQNKNLQEIQLNEINEDIEKES